MPAPRQLTEWSARRAELIAAENMNSYDEKQSLFMRNEYRQLDAQERKTPESVRSPKN